jgi:hypothetical protein
MKRISTTRALRSTALALALAGAGALAFGADPALPAERQAGGISYLTGGVADDQAAAFKQARAGYPLAIELVQRSGGKNEYTADAQVQVADLAGNVVFAARAEGPFMLVRIPPGQYRVRGTLNGRSVEAAPVTVGAQGGAQATVVFPPRTD